MAKKREPGAQCYMWSYVEANAARRRNATLRRQKEIDKTLKRLKVLLARDARKNERAAQALALLKPVQDVWTTK